MILVTGGGGVLGKALSLELAASGRAYKMLFRGDVDLRDAEATRNLFARLSPTIVMHLAGRVHGLMGNKTFPAEMFTDNARINMNVVDAAHRSGCAKFVGVSTVAVYGSSVPMPVKETSIWDGPPHHSEAAYGHAKRGMLAQLEAYQAQHGIDYAYPILTNIYGPHDRFDRVNGHVVPSLIAKFYDAANDSQPVGIWGTGIAERDFIYSKDAARALILIADSFVGPINVATGNIVKIKDIAEELKAISGVKEIAWDNTKPDGQVLRRYDISKLLSLGFVPEFGVQEGLSETFRWYAENYPNVRTT